MNAKLRRASRRFIDRKRCRFTDCVESHPQANDYEQVTCPACREWMGLPPKGEK